MRAAKLVALLGCMLGLAACGDPSQLSFGEAEAFLLEKMRAQTSTHAANGYQLEVRPVPSEYLAVREVKTSGTPTQSAYDAARESYGDARYFLLTIKPQEGVREGDIMMQDVRDYEAYQQRFLELSFSLREHLSLEYEGGSLQPVLSNTEHDYGLSAHRSAMLAFVPRNEEELQALSSGALTLVFDDRIFNTGINRFAFDASNLSNLPPVEVTTL